MLAIDLNSASHVIADGDDGAPLQVPALAVLEPPVPLLGEAAARRARLAPLFVSRTHWEHPDHTALPRGLPGAMTRAEVAYAQLAELWPVAARSGVVTVSPAAEPDDVARLAGLFAASGRTPLAWVDAAVAATAGRPASRRALWVEAEAGRTVLAELVREPIAADGAVHDQWMVRRGRVEVSRAVGMTVIDDAVARGIAQHFLRVARFDPLAVAATEQALYDALPKLHGALAAGQPATVVLGEGNGRREALVEPADLVAACAPLVAEVLRLVQSAREAGEPLTLHLGQRLAVLPGLVPALQGLVGVQLDCLPTGAAAVGARAAMGGDAVDGEGARWLTVLAGAAAVEVVAVPLPVQEVPTHVLWQGRAWPLSSTPLRLGRSPSPGGLVLEGPPAGLSREHCQLLLAGGEAVVEDLSTYGTWLNGEKVRRRARLRVGDVLRLGVPGVELALVAVEPRPPAVD